MITLFTDYGLTGPYLGQVRVRMHEYSPQCDVITLMADAPAHEPKASAYLLDAFSRDLPQGTVIFSVIDPDVGSDEHKPVIIRARNNWLVGPNNGLFDLVCRNASDIESWEITWRPDRLTSTFHGRDLYAPVCAMLDKGEGPPGEIFQWYDNHQWPDDLYEVVYIDQFGNVMTGIHEGRLSGDVTLQVGGISFNQASTFSDVKPGNGFWYENSSGLVELAVNQGSAAELLRIKVSDPVRVK
jgi:S-adenosylmethionine hydrolase